MSVKFIKNPAYKGWGTFEITTNDNTLGHEDYVYRIKSLISLIGSQDDSLATPDEVRTVLQILNDMMPTPEQAEQMFKSPH